MRKKSKKKGALLVLKNKNNTKKIAIIDTGVDEAFLKKPLKYKVYVNQENQCIADNIDHYKNNFVHGTICALIIEKYCSDFELSSVRILSEDGTGMIDSLQPAFEWCLKHEFFIVNLSLGTTYFKSKNLIKHLVNYYANQGLYIIAATANSGHITYPASFSNAISVAADNYKYCCFLANRHLGIDFIVSLRHTLEIDEQKVLIQKSNSYATPYVTAMVSNLFFDANLQSILNIKLALAIDLQDNLYFQSECYEPDWICAATIITKKIYSRAKYYFKEVIGTVEDVLDQIDTIVIERVKELDKVIPYNKNIVFLGTLNIETKVKNNFFWSPQNRLKQILNCNYTKEQLDIPIIVCEFLDCIDEIFFLTELKLRFYENDYNMYPISLKPESVLYDLEYIPEACLEDEKIIYLSSFMYWQTKHKQSDGIILGINHSSAIKQKKLLQIADIHLKMSSIENVYKIDMLCEGVLFWSTIVSNIDTPTIHLLYQQMEHKFTENTEV